jgi:hypothetical protein
VILVSSRWLGSQDHWHVGGSTDTINRQPDGRQARPPNPRSRMSLELPEPIFRVRVKNGP